MNRLLASLAMAASIFAASAPGAQIPRKAQEFVFQIPDGTQQLLSMYKGRTVVLAFMYATCPHCQKTAGVLTQVQKEYQAKGVQVLSAVFGKGDAARALDFRTSLGLNFPVGVSEDRAVLEFLQVPVTDPYFVPILVFIDKRGMVRSQYVGDEKFLNNQEVNIRAEIDKLLRPTGTTTTSAAAPKSPKS